MGPTATAVSTFCQVTGSLVQDEGPGRLEQPLQRLPVLLDRGLPCRGQVAVLHVLDGCGQDVAPVVQVVDLLGAQDELVLRQADLGGTLAGLERPLPTAPPAVLARASPPRFAA